MEIERTGELKILEQRLRDFPVVAILGPRQCGKTTLARQFARGVPSAKIHFFDLEDPQDLARLENPTLALGELQGTVVIDEIQRCWDLFSVLRVLVDRQPKVRYLILGSASQDLIHQGAESLAGRISFLEIGGFSLQTVPEDPKKLWIRGGFPRSFLSRSEQVSYQWRQEFVRTFLERDIPNLGIRVPARTLRRFWLMLAHYHGQVFNASELARSMAVADTTIKGYLDILSGTFMLRQLHPWFYKTKKRLVKSPKVYLRDSGIFHALLSIQDSRDLMMQPRLGASWEGFALEQVITHLGLSEEEAYFWAVHSGAQCDLVFQRRGRMWGVEVKYTEAPRLAKSMVSAVEELSLAHLWILCPAKRGYPLAKNVSVISLGDLRTIRP